MIKFKEKEVTTKQQVKISVVCDVCKKEYFYESEDQTDIFETQEFVSLSYEGGYGSVFGDDDQIEIDICQSCLKEKLGEYIRVS